VLKHNDRQVNELNLYSWDCYHIRSLHMLHSSCNSRNAGTRD